MHTLISFNQLPPDQASKELFKCCGSSKWVNKVIEQFPFSDENHLMNVSTTVWYDECEEEDYMEAYAYHPRIGDKDSLKEKFASTHEWAGEEQAGVDKADDAVVEELASENTQQGATQGLHRTEYSRG